MLTSPNNGALFVTNYDNTILQVNLDGTHSVICGLYAVPGSTDGKGTVARFRRPTGIAIAPNGNIFVAANRSIRQITTEGIVSTICGDSWRGFFVSTDGKLNLATFTALKGIALRCNFTWSQKTHLFFTETSRRRVLIVLMIHAK